MAQDPTTNLNVPPPPDTQIADTGKGVVGRLTEKWRAWFTALAGVKNDWTVGGLLTAAKATITGLLTAGSMVLTAAGVPPFNGKLYAGDTGWIEIGSTGAPAFQNGWVNFGAPNAPAAFRRMSDGTVRVKGLVKSGTVNATIFTLPAGYRAAEQVQLATVSGNGTAEVASRLQIDTNGAVAQAAAPAGYNFFCSVNCSFYAEA